MGVLGDIGSKFSGAVSIQGVTSSVTIMIFIFIIAVLTGILIYVIINTLKFNKRIVLYENIAGQGYIPTSRDKAKIVKIGDGGEEILFLKRRKIFRTAYGKKIGKNSYAFAIGSDGYWYNITFGDLDKSLSELKIDPVDRDMRYMHVAIRKNIKERYEQVTFLQKYGGLIAYVALIAVTGIMMWLLFDKYIQITGSVGGAVEAAERVVEAANRLLGAIDNVQGGSGLSPA